MVDSLCARRGLYISNNEYRRLKHELKKKFDDGNMTSSYFECFDEEDVKPTTRKQKKYIDLASKIAMKSVMTQKHGAIIVYKKEIIATGFNYNINNLYSIHAEMDALASMKKQYKHLLPDCELYVVRIGPDRFDNPLKYSKPCFNCQNAITKLCIKKTFYSTNYEYDNITALNSCPVC
jgi:deoxycytidylate deaminase